MESSDDESLESLPAGVVVYTEDEIINIGLRTIGLKDERINRLRHATKIKKFQKSFGPNPAGVLTCWNDLQTTAIKAAFVEPEDRKIEKFLMALYQLKRYPTDDVREQIFDLSANYSRDWVWFFIEKIRALKAQKIVWASTQEDIWVCTVDGTHCQVHEVAHPEFSLDPAYFSHKHNKCGITYELGISLRLQRLVWMNGGFKAGTNDVSIFCSEGGLKEKLIHEGKMAIGDGGYQGHEDQISTPNSIDSRAVRKFKSRALHRHEKFNGYTKRYACLSGRFRHSPAKFCICFEAVCVLCQYQLDVGQDYLYDIFVEDVLAEV